MMANGFRTTMEQGLDLILDVMNKADPAARRAGLQKLKAAMMSKQQADSFKPVEVPQLRKDQTRLTTGPADSSVPARKRAMRELETVLAKNMVSAMMPKDQSRLYGEGMAGDVWRGFQLDVMGKAIADEGLLSGRQGGRQDADSKPSRGAPVVTPFSG
jgi:peptidoglycan hydrolase FlgJ